MEKIDTISWKIIDKYFQNNNLALVDHHISSYNDFFDNNNNSTKNIQQIFRDTNPIKIRKNKINEIDDYEYQIDVYIGGKNGSRIYYGLPVINDSNDIHYMLPNEGRLKNMSYMLSVSYDIEIEMKEINLEDGEVKTLVEEMEYKDVLLGKFPLMLKSKLCLLSDVSRNVLYNMGECMNEKGGYFIIDGKEKAFIPQEIFANNMINITKNKNTDKYSYSASIRTVAEDPSKPVRTLKVHIEAPTSRYTNNNIVVEIPNVRKPIPLFIVMRALGVISDMEIINYCLLDMNENEEYIDLFIPSVHDASIIFSTELAIKYIGLFTKKNTVVEDILINYLLPNVGENNFINKAYFIGDLVFKLLKVFRGVMQPTDRDNFKYKRVELIGPMMYDLFKEYYKTQIKKMKIEIEKKFYFSKNENVKLTIENTKDTFNNSFKLLIMNRKVLGIVENGFLKAFKGRWGGSSNTSRVGVIQDLNRLSNNSGISLLRKINLDIDESAKVVGPRLLHSSQFGLIDPIDTPDGGNIGTHKHMSIITHISNDISKEKIEEWIFNEYSKDLIKIDNQMPKYLNNKTKIYLNGIWIAVTDHPSDVVTDMKDKRRKGKILDLSQDITKLISITFNILTNSIIINCDGGRLLRPLYYLVKGETNNQLIAPNLMDNDYNWNKISNYLDFVDSMETEDLYICMDYNKLNSNNLYTHMEIKPSLMFGVMGNQVIFPEHNPPSRNLFSCGQSKQAVSLYHTNYHNRMDKTSYVLNYGQVPLIKSFYNKYINNNQHPYGVNTTVAIMCLDGYNVEDAILVNEGSIKRGLFNTTYYSVYECSEKSSEVKENDTEKIIENVTENVKVRLNDKKNYKFLDSLGIIKENIMVDDNTVIIGSKSYSVEDPDIIKDTSICPKKGQIGYVDKSFISSEKEGYRIAKVKIREERIPAVGDKMASRAGQKGTIGIIIPEEDMPYTDKGLKPDLIINPHAIPSRMTIGQLIEVLLGKSCVEKGLFGDCTAYHNTDSSEESKIDVYGKILQELNYESGGNELMYDGCTGKQLSSKIFIGPTYYMRLKHIVKDKINYRADGPRNVLTRQTVQGRANDGGLRIGEMERDGIIANGMASFLKDSFMIRGDKFSLAICNNSGGIAIYNVSRDEFYSPLIDGEVKFDEPIREDSKLKVIQKYGLDFSIIKIPYCLKLLIQEIQSMNISIRLITEDNINNLMNMNKDIQKINLKNRKNIEIPENSTKDNILNTDIDLSDSLKYKDLDGLEDNDENVEIDQLELPEIDESIYTIDYDSVKISEDLLNKDEEKEIMPLFYPGSIVGEKFGEPLQPDLFKVRTPDGPPPGLYEPTTPEWSPPKYEPTTPEWSPPKDQYEPTTPEWSPPNSNENKFEVEKISLDKFQNIKDSITLAKNKSLIKQDDLEENKDDSDDDTKGIKMI